MKFKVARQMHLTVYRARRHGSDKVKPSWKKGSGGRCVWCNISVKPSGLGPNAATREHLIPRSMGGGGGGNIAVACARCNHTRQSQTTWIRWLNVEHYAGFTPTVGTAYGWDGHGGVIEVLRPVVIIGD